MSSIWQSDGPLPEFPAQSGDMSADVLLVGGGLTGLLCGHLLQKQGLCCLVAEADRLMSGTSGRTTAKVTAQHGLIYSRLRRRLGQETAAMYYQAQRAALEQYFALDIPCHLARQDAFLFSRTGTQAIEEECRVVRSFGGDASVGKAPALPFPTAGVLRFPDQAQLHPLFLARGLLSGLTILEHTPVLSLTEDGAVTPFGRIRAKHVVVATRFPFLRFRGGYFLRLYQKRSYVLALRPAEPLEGMYLDAAENGLSLRSWGDTLLLGGGGHRTGKSGGGFAALFRAARQYFPQAWVLGQWAAQDCVTLDSIPYIGSYGPDRYVAAGFGKWGLTNAMAAALVLSGQILKKPVPYAPLFAPDRHSPLLPLAKNGLSSAGGLLTPTAPRCPHMGCALKRNAAEQSWDCPCHGSRFDAAGRLLEGPAQRDKKHPPQGN